jgi:hypothetical protein
MSRLGDIDMAASLIAPTELNRAHASAIASLSERLDLPINEVRQTYLKELDRLGSQARIRGFIDALAVGRTRSILRSRKRLQRLAISHISD